MLFQACYHVIECSECASADWTGNSQQMSPLLCQLSLCALVTPADIAYCKNPFTDRFHCFDDEEVRDVSQGSIKVSWRLLASGGVQLMCSNLLAHPVMTSCNLRW